MMQWGVQRADAEGVESYLDFTPGGKLLYKRFGFKNLEEWSFFANSYRHSFMARNPKERER